MANYKNSMENHYNLLSSLISEILSFNFLLISLILVITISLKNSFLSI